MKKVERTTLNDNAAGERIEELEADSRPEWNDIGEAATLAGAAEDADEWLALIERLHHAGRWKFSDSDSAEKLRGCRQVLRRFLTPRLVVSDDQVGGEHLLPQSPNQRVLVIVSGGVADYAHDNGVTCELFDFDNYRDDPVGTGKVSQQFADLAAAFDAPVEDIAGLVVEHAKHDSSQTYVGPITNAAEKFVVQNIGRGKGVIHLAENLSRVPAFGETVEIAYGNGHAAVIAAGKEHGKAVER